MKTLFMTGIISLLALGTSTARADCQISGGKPECTSVTLGELYVDSTGVWIQTSGTESRLNTTSTSSCVPLADKYVWLDLQHANFDALMSSLLSAKLSDAPVSLRLNRDTSRANRCVISYMRFL